jgi:transcription elongation factor GreA
MPPEYLTKQGFKKIQEELDHLRNVRRREVAERLREAAENSLGEFVEDPEFESAKNEQAFVEGRIRELEVTLANARLITHKGGSKNGVVEIGSKVTIKEGRQKEEEYIIVGHAEANPREGKISHDSPLGRALLEKKEGDSVKVDAPDGAFTVRIVKVK